MLLYCGRLRVQLGDDCKFFLDLCFSEAEINVEVENNTLTVSSISSEGKSDSERNYLHRGIAERHFKRQFKLADHIKVNGATMENGLLHIDLEREVPEAMKPRQITIKSNVDNSRLLKSA